MNDPYFPRGYDSIDSVHKRLRTVDERTLTESGAERALELFHEMAKRVPAYKDFLAGHGFKVSSVKSVDDFHKIPPIDKANYLRQYPHDMLCWDGAFPTGQWVISSTSGTTGEPYYFPRQDAQDAQYALTAELYLRDNFQIDKRKTLYVVAFPMGAWIGGLFTYEALHKIASTKQYDLSIVTPGIHKQEVINAVRRLGDKFDQVIIGAYAPFLKDIITDGKAQGIDWSALNVGFVFSAEAFSENFRDFIFNEVQPAEPLKASLNHYGTVDLGTMAHETPESVLVRRSLVDSDSLGSLLPEERRQPTLAQYNPELFYFEQVGRNLYCSAYSGIPLVRYDLKDYGGVIARTEVHEVLGRQGIDVSALADKHAIGDTLVNLPYVYVYERDDLSVSYYGFLLYPDMIRSVLERQSLADLVTGKFSMQVQYDGDGRQILDVHVELSDGHAPGQSVNRAIQEVIHQSLHDASSEYRETHRMVGEVVTPVIHSHVYSDPEYFKTGTKQRWTIR